MFLYVIYYYIIFKGKCKQRRGKNLLTAVKKQITYFII